MKGLNNYILAFIILALLSSLLFLTLLLISRLNKIYEKRLINRYVPIIDKLLFSILFNDEPVHKVIESNLYQSVYKHKSFKKTLLASIVKLHEEYSGDYNEKLEDFYHQSGLIKISFFKLKSKAWHEQCEGIRELSQMNIKAGISDIKKCIWHNNATLKLEALIAVIRLQGVEGLSVLHEYNEQINDWIQLNLIFELENSNLEAVESFSHFLKSKNESLVIFGLRLIAKFNQIQSLDQIWELQFSNASDKVKTEALRTLERLPSMSIYNRAKS
ncbi:MAG TPA: hypothetical protein VGP43_04190 [Chitinophagaceae bacterium]|nr:hypothetical protein [Chitinophagaceae bacterium]